MLCAILILSSPNIFAKSDPQALAIIQKMLGSLNHISTMQSKVTLVKKTPERTVTINYELKADNKNEAVVIIKDKIKQTYVLNNKGYFLVTKGEPIKQNGKAFPFDNPAMFLKELNLAEVTDNYQFVINSDTDEFVIIDMLPLGTAGKSISASTGEASITKLRFTIYKPWNTLQKLEMFKNYQPTTKDILEFRYEIVENKRLTEKGIFRNKYTTSQELALTYYKSVADLGKDKNGNPNIQVKELFYKNIILNEILDRDVFDEEDY
jgi:hypothetical protein